jgi:hypothetical protein
VNKLLHDLAVTLGGGLKRTIAQGLVFALILSSLPVPASAASKGVGKTVAIAGVAGGAIVLAIFYVVKRHVRRAPKLMVDVPAAVRFDHLVPGQPTKESVPVTNPMSEAVIVEAVTAEDKSGVLTLGDVRQTPFTLVPGERLEIPVALSANNKVGRARLRIVVTTARAREVHLIVVFYGYKEHKEKEIGGKEGGKRKLIDDRIINVL